MDFATPTNSKVAKEAQVLGGAIVGGAVSDGVIRLLPSGLTTKGLLTIGTGFAAASVKGNDSGSNLLKGAFIGMAITQGIAAIRQLVGSSASNYVASNQGKASAKFVAGLADADGLGAWAPLDQSIVPQYTMAPQEEAQPASVQALGTPFSYASSTPFGV